MIIEENNEIVFLDSNTNFVIYKKGFNLEINNRTLDFYSELMIDKATVELINEDNTKVKICNLNIENQLIAYKGLDNGNILFIFSYEKEIFYIIQKINNNKNEFEYVKIDSFHNLFKIKQSTFNQCEIYFKNKLIHENNNIYGTKNNTEYLLKEEIGFSEMEKDLIFLFKIEFFNRIICIYFDIKENRILYKKTKMNCLFTNNQFNARFLSEEILEIEINGQFKNIYLNQITFVKPFKIFEISKINLKQKFNIHGIYTINKRRYFIYEKSNYIYFGKSNFYELSGYESILNTFKIFNKVYFYGKSVHYAKNAFMKYDNVYINKLENKIGKLKRPFFKIPLLRRFVYFNINLNNLPEDIKIHNNIFLGSDDYLLHNLLTEYKLNKSTSLNSKCRNLEKEISISNTSTHSKLFRVNKENKIQLTIIPFSKEYRIVDRIKLKISEKISKFTKRNRKINLYFEKKSEKADESSYRVFNEVFERKEEFDSENYFILSKNASNYNEMKKKYGNYLIEKNSFKHYKLIFESDNFVSSELSNHVLNDRLFLANVSKKINTTPLVFLQHGIMFAKPVDNPMAFGFHKDKIKFNIIKSVVSSKLEAEQFYKMGYEDEDLIYSGLSTLDFAKLDEDANKIAFMPTYRYWEEYFIYNNEIEKTSYYKTIINFIKYFEKKGRLNDLLIVPHNKFSNYIYNNIPEYKNIICDNPTEALKKSKIFITDYSSAIYDAIFRGSYPIFYWEEKDYLIENYKAIPPVNEENAPGTIVYDLENLYKNILNIESNKYKLDDEILKKYRNINNYSDYKNTSRIIENLVKNNIL